jgi:cytidylate kinase
VARRVAQLLEYLYIDTGAMYRAIALKAQRKSISLDATDELVSLADASKIDLRANNHTQPGAQQVLLDGEDVSSQIRSAEISQAASKVATVPGVRHVLVTEQRRAGHKGGVVMEGRDIGTVVFPDAELKIFLTASVEVRAERRWREHQQKGDTIELAQVIEQVRERDKRDRERVTSPLVQAADAVLVDSTAMDAEEVAKLIVMLAERKVASD